jgi:hypothetical protein
VQSLPVNALVYISISGLPLLDAAKFINSFHSEQVPVPTDLLSKLNKRVYLKVKRKRLSDVVKRLGLVTSGHRKKGLSVSDCGELRQAAGAVTVMLSGGAERDLVRAEASSLDAVSAALYAEAAEVASSCNLRRHSHSYSHSRHRIRRPALVFGRAAVVRHFRRRRHKTSPN